MSERVYNPLHRDNLGASVAEALLERVPRPIDELEKFDGAGVYAIYYTGDFSLYAPIAAANRDDQWRWPIYIGKAIPAGGRKGGAPTEKETRPLSGRLKEHAGSIKAAENLRVSDFSCRYLVVEDIWIPLGESLLIAKFSPIWNKLMDGFGNHAPGKGRHAGMKPRWDVVHPGRTGFDRCQPRAETVETIMSEVETYLRGAPTPPIRPRILLDH